MDGLHDLGGREGFGPVPGKEEGRPFHEEWETRAFGIMSAVGEPEWTIDWSRYCRELIPPVDYLTRPYFDQWATVVAAQLIDAGYLTLDELKSRKSLFHASPESPPSTPEAAQAFVRTPKSYAADVSSEPAFAIGDAVRAKLSNPAGHTRLPGYVRGRSGIVVAHHGGHLLPDAGACGEQWGEHLYTVSFAASELWPEAEGRRDRVMVDLWESYVEPA
ncbi:MAG TPA: nitrile hydratase subunit beta [Mesorhizobium sp.]|jgi:nitrile hydratase|nr:nitrile hydratase subunit beta [Mesorhizobium sp.]